MYKRERERGGCLVRFDCELDYIKAGIGIGIGIYIYLSIYTLLIYLLRYPSRKQKPLLLHFLSFSPSPLNSR